MDSRQYNNVIDWTLNNDEKAQSDDALTVARAVCTNLGVALPQGDLPQVSEILATDDYMGWHSCTKEEAQAAADCGIPAIVVSNDSVAVLTASDEDESVSTNAATMKVQENNNFSENDIVHYAYSRGTTSGSYGRFDEKNRGAIIKDFVELLGNKKLDIPVLNLFYLNTTEQCVNVVLNNDIYITNMANEFGVHKAFIQTILLRELWCLNMLDEVGDGWVVNHYEWKQACRYWESQDSVYQALVEYPAPPVPNKDDSSVGLGQIFARVAIAAYNRALHLGYVTGREIDPEDWMQRRDVWYTLKNDNSYNIKMSTLNLLSCVDEYGYNHNYSTYTPDQFKHVFTRYNENTTAINDYGEACYQYYLIFKKYM